MMKNSLDESKQCASISSPPVNKPHSLEDSFVSYSSINLATLPSGLGPLYLKPED